MFRKWMAKIQVGKCIAHISHHRHYFFQAGVLFSSENAKGTAFSKVYSDNINTNPHILLSGNIRYIIQSSECFISCNKYTIPMQKTPSMPNIDLRCFVAMQFLSQIYALFWRTIYRPKNTVAYKKWQIWGMGKWLKISRLLECVGLREADVLIFDIVDGSILRWSRGFKQIENKYCPLVAWKDLKRRSTNGYC